MKGKAQTVIWIHDSMMIPVLAHLEEMVETKVDPRLALREAMRDIVELMDVHPGSLRVFFENHRELPARMRKVAVDRRDRYVALVEVLLTRGMRRGIFRKVPTRLTALAMFGITNWCVTWSRHSDGERKQGYDYRLRGSRLRARFAAGAVAPQARTAISP